MHENTGTDRMMNTDITAPKTQGGTQSKRVTVGLYPMVAAMVGKKIPYVTPMSKKVPAIASHHTVQSVRTSTRPSRCPLFCSTFPWSSSILFRASICSSAESHKAGVAGKSGIIWNDAIATMHVKLPSIKKSHLQNASRQLISFSQLNRLPPGCNTEFAVHRGKDSRCEERPKKLTSRCTTVEVCQPQTEFITFVPLSQNVMNKDMDDKRRTLTI